MNIRTLRHSVLAALALSLVSTAASATGGLQFPSLLQGAWEVTITPYVCATGQSLPTASFQSYVSFGAGGTASETTSNANFQPGQRSPSHGYWERTGFGQFHSVLKSFIQFTSVVTPPAVPRYTRGTQRIEQGIELVSRDRWTSTATVTFFDAAGVVVPPTGCMTAVGVRME